MSDFKVKYEELDDTETVVSNGYGEVLEGSNDINDVNIKNDVNQWSVIDGKMVPVSNTVKNLEAGYYSINVSNKCGLYFIKNEVHLNKLYRLPNKATDIILDDIDKFWTLEEKYKKYNRVFRRNYLLYSAPGTGKTSLINLMCKDLIEKYNGIVISLTTSDEIRIFVEAMRILRKIEPNRKVIAIIEDIDNFTGDEYSRSTLDTYLLNILDGNMKMDGIVIIATTNHIEKMENRYKNRPSRFNKVIEFPLPNDESRKMFIEKTILPEDLKKINIEEWVMKTNGYTIDHLNELIQLVFVFCENEEESFKVVSEMVKNNNTLKNDMSLNNGKKMIFS